MTRRTIRGLLAAALLGWLVAGPVSAGGWAAIVADEGQAQPRAGEPAEIGFSVLQHGVTPAGWVTAFVELRNGATGEELSVAARQTGADGHFAATVTLPDGGFWTWQVRLLELEVDAAPVPITVRLGDGSLPAMDPSLLLAAIEAARRDVATELRDELGRTIDALDARVGTLTNEIARVVDQRNALEARVEAMAGGSAALPPIAIVLLAVLAGATSGFVITLLGRPAATPERTAGGGAARLEETPV